MHNLIPLIEQDIQIATNKSINLATIGIGIANDQGNEEVIFFALEITRISQAAVAHAFIPAFRKQRQVDLCEFKVGLVYKS